MAKRTAQKISKKRFVIINAGPLERAIAFAADILIIRFTIMLPFQKVLNELLSAAGGNNENFSASYNFFLQHPEIADKLYAVLLMVSLTAILYFAILESKLGQSIGKMLVGIRVVSAVETKENGRKVRKEDKVVNPSFLQCILRSIFLIPLFPIVLLWIIDPLFMIFRKDHRRLLELMTWTKTVRYQEY